MEMGIVAPANAEKPISWTRAGRCGRSNDTQSIDISPPLLCTKCAVLTGPIVDYPEEKVTQECGKLRVQFQTSRPAHEPRHHSPESIDRPRTKDEINLCRYKGCILNDESAQGDAHDDIIRNKP